LIRFLFSVQDLVIFSRPETQQFFNFDFDVGNKTLSFCGGRPIEKNFFKFSVQFCFTFYGVKVPPLATGIGTRVVPVAVSELFSVKAGFRVVQIGRRETDRVPQRVVGRKGAKSGFQDDPRNQKLLRNKICNSKKMCNLSGFDNIKRNLLV
jgi:hypothetical protein